MTVTFQKFKPSHMNQGCRRGIKIARAYLDYCAQKETGHPNYHRCCRDDSPKPQDQTLYITDNRLGKILHASEDENALHPLILGLL